MNMRNMKLSIIILGLILTLCLLGYPPVQAQPDNSTWKLGDDIVPVPIYNEKFDCDDANLYSYLFLAYSEYNPKVMYGNLKLTNETFDLCNHYWLIVTSDNIQYPYAEGYYVTDEQYFEGFVVPYGKLLYWAYADQR